MNAISQRLAPLASLAAQRRYITRATKDAYYGPSDLLHNVSDVVRQVQTMRSVQDSLSPEARQSIIALTPLIEAADLAASRALDNEDLIERDRAWDALRKHVAECLEIMSFDLQQWEKAEALALPPRSGDGT